MKFHSLTIEAQLPSESELERCHSLLKELELAAHSGARYN
jgi:hypothetical protein